MKQRHASGCWASGAHLQQGNQDPPEHLMGTRLPLFLPKEPPEGKPHPNWSQKSMRDPTEWELPAPRARDGTAAPWPVLSSSFHLISWCYQHLQEPQLQLRTVGNTASPGSTLPIFYASVRRSVSAWVKCQQLVAAPKISASSKPHGGVEGVAVGKICTSPKPLHAPPKPLHAPHLNLSCSCYMSSSVLRSK